MKNDTVISRIRQKYTRLASTMDRRLRRQWAAAEALDLGWGGVTAVALATGLDRHTILAGTRELRKSQGSSGLQAPLKRSPGGGRKPITHTDPKLPSTLETLLEPASQGLNEPPLRWTFKSTTKLAHELQELQHQISDRTVASLLQNIGYTLQARRKGKSSQPWTQEDSNAQFEYISELVRAFQTRAQPAIWVETKNKAIKAPRFATDCIRRWWDQMGSRNSPDASALLVVAEVAGADRRHKQSWRQALQDLANELQIPLEICHCPPATIKWSKIEQRLSSAIERDHRGRSWTEHEVVVHVIARTNSNRRNLETSFKLEDLAGLNEIPTWFHGDWNFAVHPLRSDGLGPLIRLPGRFGRGVSFPS